MESFDPKPALNEHAGKTIAESPLQSGPRFPLPQEEPARVRRQQSQGLSRRSIRCRSGTRNTASRESKSATGGRTWPNASMTWPSSVRCGPPTTITGRNCNSTPGGTALEGQFPTIGSWIHYGLGTLNENLPQFAVMGTPIADCCGGVGAHGANYLGPEHAGVQLSTDPKNPLPFAGPGTDVYREEQQRRIRPARSAQPSGRRRISRRRRARSPHQGLRAGLSHAGRRSRGRQLRRRDRPPREACMGSTTRRPKPSAGSAWSRAGWSRRGRASCRSFTAPTAAPAPGMRTAPQRRATPRCARRSISRSPV